MPKKIIAIILTFIMASLNFTNVFASDEDNVCSVISAEDKDTSDALAFWDMGLIGSGDYSGTELVSSWGTAQTHGFAGGRLIYSSDLGGNHKIVFTTGKAITEDVYTVKVPVRLSGALETVKFYTQVGDYEVNHCIMYDSGTLYNLKGWVAGGVFSVDNDYEFALVFENPEDTNEKSQVTVYLNGKNMGTFTSNANFRTFGNLRLLVTPKSGSTLSIGNIGIYSGNTAQISQDVSLSVKDNKLCLNAIPETQYDIKLLNPKATEGTKAFSSAYTFEELAAASDDEKQNMTAGDVSVTTDSDGAADIDFNYKSAGKYNVYVLNSDKSAAIASHAIYAGGEVLLSDVAENCGETEFVDVMNKTLGLGTAATQKIIDNYRALSDKAFPESAATEGYRQFYAAVLLQGAIERQDCSKDALTEILSVLSELGTDTTPAVLINDITDTAAVAKRLEKESYTTVSECCTAILNSVILCGVESSTSALDAMKYLEYAGSDRYDGSDFEKKYLLAGSVSGKSFESIDELRESIDLSEAVPDDDDDTENEIIVSDRGLDFDSLNWDIDEMRKDGYLGSEEILSQYWDSGANGPKIGLTDNGAVFKTTEDMSGESVGAMGGNCKILYSSMTDYFNDASGIYTMKIPFRLESDATDSGLTVFGGGLTFGARMGSAPENDFQITWKGGITCRGTWVYNNGAVKKDTDYTLYFVYDNSGSTTKTGIYLNNTDKPIYTLTDASKKSAMTRMEITVAKTASPMSVILSDAKLWQGGINEEPFKGTWSFNKSTLDMKVNPNDEYRIRVLKPKSNHGINAFTETFTDEEYEQIISRGPDSKICGFEENVIADENGNISYTLPNINAGIYKIEAVSNGGCGSLQLYFYNKLGRLLDPDTVAENLKNENFPMLYGVLTGNEEKGKEIRELALTLKDVKYAALLAGGDMNKLYASILYGSVIEADTADNGIINKLTEALKSLNISSKGVELLAKNNDYASAASEAAKKKAETLSGAAENLFESAVLNGIKNAVLNAEAEEFLSAIGNKRYDNANSAERKQLTEAVIKKSYDSVAALSSALDSVRITDDKSGGSKGGSAGGGGGNTTKLPVILPSGGNTGGDPVGDTDLYTDVDKSHWAYEVIKSMSEKEIISGYDGMFYPDKEVTRAEFVKMLCKTFSVPEGENEVFEDVCPKSWYAPFINGAARAGLVYGNGFGFLPESFITRQDAAVMLLRFMNYAKYDIKSDSEHKTYSDSEKIADYATDAVQNLSAMGIINGRANGEFAPGESMTRAEAAKMLMFAMNNQEGGQK